LAQIIAFGVLVSPPAAPIVLSPDAAWTELLEKQGNLAAGLAAGGSFEVGGKQVVVTGVKSYPNGRALYDCIAVALVPPAGNQPV
jgi:hypothetical protein